MTDVKRYWVKFDDLTEKQVVLVSDHEAALAAVREECFRRAADYARPHMARKDKTLFEVAEWCEQQAIRTGP